MSNYADILQEGEDILATGLAAGPVWFRDQEIDAATDAILRRYADHADFLIYDAQYTTEEYEQRRGWGHSTWGEAVKFAREARVKQLILFHHDPLRTDGQLDRIVRDAQSEFENTIAAKEGWCAKF